MNKSNMLSDEGLRFFTDASTSIDDFVRKNDCKKEQLYKNICLSVISGVRRKIVLVSVPLDKNISIEKTASCFHVRPSGIKLIPADRLLQLTGYDRDGIPFIGLNLEHFLDRDAMKYPFIISGAGGSDAYVQVDRTFYSGNSDITLADFTISQ
jgi:prolyl-tRNA editing enzyme YbaK/EbsC (Cys-tRNA(Pro) deacylase)